MTCSWLTASIPACQCRWPGAFSQALTGEGRWRCYFHHKLLHEGHRDSAQADAVVRESEQWDGTTMEYILARKRFDDTPRPAPVAKEEAQAPHAFRDAWKLLHKKREVADAA
jgi:hypothetical protein